MKSIKFAYIAPTAYLNLIPEESRFHLVLAHLLKDKNYADFYRLKKMRGDTIIMDNGAFEFKRPLEAEELIDIMEASDFIPTVIVAPDYPFEPWQKTCESTMAFIDTFDLVKQKDDRYAKVGYMAVPQSLPGDYNGWISGYKYLTDQLDIQMIGMSILGIPTAFRDLTGTVDIATNRIYASLYLKQRKLVNPRVWHHYLGLGNGPRELIYQREIGIIDSNDSSSPFWHAINGIPFDQSATGLVGGKIKLDVDFDIEANPSKNVLSTIDQNIEWMNQYVLN